MKQKTKIALLPLLLGMMLIFGANKVQAQKYTIAAGWRAGGGPNGITLKLVPVKGFAIEGIYGIYPFGESVTVMLERSRPILCIQALQVYTGIGGHRRFNYQSGLYTDPINGTFEAIAPPGTNGWGIDAVAGIELKIPLLPVAVSAEVKPMVEWTNAGAMLYSLDPALGLKVVF